MTPLEVLRKGRELFLEGKHRLAGTLDAASLLEDAASGDLETAANALEDLDACTPKPFTFQAYADGGEFVQEGDTVTIAYRYDRTTEEIAAIFGKACALAARRGDA